TLRVGPVAVAAAHVRPGQRVGLMELLTRLRRGVLRVRPEWEGRGAVAASWTAVGARAELDYPGRPSHGDSCRSRRGGGTSVGGSRTLLRYCPRGRCTDVQPTRAGSSSPPTSLTALGARRSRS